MSNKIKYGSQNKAIILLGCFFTSYQQGFIVKDIGFILLIIVSGLLVVYRPTLLVKGLVLIGTIVLSVYFAKYALFFPVLLYDLLEDETLYSYVLFPFIGILIVISYIKQPMVLMFYLVFGIIAIVLSRQTQKVLRLEESYRELDQSSHEQRYLLEKQNYILTEEQNLNLTLGISEERNRIARDIHDNVGHLLSSSLIQIGALRVINQDQQLVEPLNYLDETIQEGMDNIRESVHNLHDDSLNLEQSLTYIVDSFQEFPIEFNYAVKHNLSASLKMDFLMIVRESLANIMKHSNGTKVLIEVVEKPMFHRLLIKDNGTKKLAANPVGRGMGLNSMKERVTKQGGRLTAEQQVDGFQVLAIVPKEKGED